MWPEICPQKESTVAVTKTTLIQRKLWYRKQLQCIYQEKKVCSLNKVWSKSLSFAAKWFYVPGFELTNCMFFFFHRFQSKSYNNETMNKLWERTNGSDENVLVRGQNFMKKTNWNECDGMIVWNTETGHRHVQVTFSSDTDRYYFSAKLCAWVCVTLMRNAAENECSLDETFF